MVVVVIVEHCVMLVLTDVVISMNEVNDVVPMLANPVCRVVCIAVIPVCTAVCMDVIAV